MTEQIIDVSVVGGGPAGAAVALVLARHGCRVRLLEATTYEEPRYGETLPPEVNPVLRELGLWDAFQSLAPLEAPGTISVWGSPTPVEADFIHNVHGTGWHIDRRSFDEMLVTEAERAGVDVVLGRRVQKCDRQGDLWCVNGSESRFLVDASGRNGLRLDGNLERKSDDTLLAIALSVPCPELPRQDLRTCVESNPSGWWYTAPLPKGPTIAMFFTDPERYRTEGISIQDQLLDAPVTAMRLKGGHIVSYKVLHVISSRRNAVFGQHWLAVGDSACSYDPIAGRGIFSALRRAKVSAAAIVAYLDGNLEPIAHHANQIRLEYDEYVLQRRLHYRSEQRWSSQPFWKARHG